MAALVTPKFLSPRDLALAVGASESSLKRWIDDGRVRVLRTAGGHRRIPLAEAVRFIRKYHHQVLRPDLLGIPADAHGPDPHGADRLLRALTAGDAPAVHALLANAYLARGSVAELADAMICPALCQLGEPWSDADDGIVIEHQSIDVLLQVVPRLRALIAPPNPDAPLALGGAPSGDPYLLPSQLAALVLADAGLRTVNLGPDTPCSTFSCAIGRHQPRLVWLACSSESAAAQIAPRLPDLAAGLASSGVRFVLGGRAMPATPPGIERVATFAALADLGRDLIQASGSRDRLDEPERDPGPG